MADEARPSRGEMSLLEHLMELRTVLLQSTLAIGVASVGGWMVADRALDWLARPVIGKAVEDLKFLSPGGAFILRVKTALGVGVFIAAPIVVWRLWSFVVPGLLTHERRLAGPLIATSLVLFYAGISFSYFVVLPFTLEFLMSFSTQHLKPLLVADQYYPFVMQEMLAFGAVFQFPLVVAALTYVGVLPPDFLKRYWRHGVVLVFVVSAILTPPDVASQLMMAAPTLVLYVFSMALAQAAAKARQVSRERRG